MKASGLPAWMTCLMLVAAGAATSSTIAYACSSSGCSSGCKEAAMWCINGTDLGYDFSASVVLSGPCSVSPQGGTPYNLQPRSYNVFGACSPECSSDSVTPGAITTNVRESVGQGNYYTYCQIDS